ncbi:MAG: hypothetical protein JWN89_70 [Parcubacteria group bacterium]|nr:hypothetical protein [Parcubacteria group bacterium]
MKFFSKAEGPTEENIDRPRSAIEQKMYLHTEGKLMRDYIVRRGISPADEEGTSKAVQEWIDTYASDYEKVFAEMLKQEPDLVQRWSSEIDTTFHSMVDNLEHRLYHADSGSERAA